MKTRKGSEMKDVKRGGGRKGSEMKDVERGGVK